MNTKQTVTIVLLAVLVIGGLFSGFAITAASPRLSCGTPGGMFPKGIIIGEQPRGITRSEQCVVIIPDRKMPGAFTIENLDGEKFAIKSGHSLPEGQWDVSFQDRQVVLVMGNDSPNPIYNGQMIDSQSRMIGETFTNESNLHIEIYNTYGYQIGKIPPNASFNIGEFEENQTWTFFLTE